MERIERRQGTEPRPDWRAPILDINATTAKVIAERLGCELAFADTVVAGRPYRSPESFLALPEVQKQDWLVPALQLLTLTQRAARRASQAVESFVDPLSDLECGLKDGGDGRERVYIAHPIGVELISLAISEEGDVELASLHIGGDPIGAFARAPVQDRALMLNLIHSPQARLAPDLHAGQVPGVSPRLAEASAAAAEILGTLQGFSQRALQFGTGWFEPPAGSPATHWLTNGCTGMPNGDWKECCDEHDLCYAATPLGQRWRCDLELARCIAGHGGPEHWIVGLIYGLGTLLLGGPMDKIGVVTGDDPKDPLAVPPMAPPGPPPRIGWCDFVVHCTDIKYKGEDVGDTWRISFSNGPSDHVKFTPGEFNLRPGGTKNLGGGDIVYTSTTHAGSRVCRDEVPGFSIYIDVENHGQGKKIFFSPFECGGQKYNPITAVVPIEKGLPLFKSWAYLEFTFVIDTKCKDDI